MKKHIISGVLILFMFSFLTCDHEFAFPKEIQIKGSPDIKFGASVDLSEIFEEAITGMKTSLSGAAGIELIECKNTVYETFMIYMELLDRTINLADNNPFGTEVAGLSPDLIKILKDLGLYHDDPNLKRTIPPEGLNFFNDKISLPLDGVGDLLSGFSFNDAYIFLYVSGSGGLVNLLSIELTLPDGKIIYSDIHSARSSGRAGWAAGYSGAQAPGGYAAAIPLSSMKSGNTPQEIGCKIYIKGGKTITPADLDLTGDILVEAVIWLPLVLTVTNPNGASIEIMGSIMDNVDLFGRTASPEESENNLDLENFVSWLKLELILNNKLFEGAKVVAQNPTGVKIEVPLTGNSITVDINENKLKDINDPSNIPFNPSISLKFENNAKLIIPKDFNIKIIKFGITAGLNVKIPLPWAAEE